MQYSLFILLLIALLFLTLCWVRDVAPRELMDKLVSRVLGRPSRVRSKVSSAAPYSRFGAGAQPVHKPVLLNLATSEGSGQACHPDVVYLSQGFGARKWPYWMVCTPYPHMDSSVENPEVFASFDGVQWEVPDGLRNPIVHKPQNAGDHNSDPDLLCHGGKLWLYYRETIRSAQPPLNRILLVHSEDGVQWSEPLEVLRDDGGTQLLSPAVICEDGRFWMWAVEWLDGQLKITRRASEDGISWSGPEITRLEGLDRSRQPWHIDVTREEGRLSAVLTSCTGLGGAGCRIHYAHSQDGLNWKAEAFLLDQVYEFEAKLQYRSSLRRVSNGTPEYELWYSAASPTDMFSVAYQRLRRDGDRLYACTSQGGER